MPRKQQSLGKIEDIKLRINKCNWVSPSGSMYIYNVIPLSKKRSMRRHPRYHTYSIFANKSYEIGEEIECDLNVTESPKDGSLNYTVTKIYYSFPKTAKGQWEYLNHFASEHSFKRVYNVIDDTYKENVKILEVLTGSDEDNQTLRAVVESQMPDALKDKFHQLCEKIAENKKLAVISNALPKELSDEITDTVLTAIGQINPIPDSAVKSFMHNPFVLIDTADGIGFKKADKLRAKLHELYPKKTRYFASNIYRLQYGADSVISDYIQSKGNTYLPFADFKKAMLTDLNINEEHFEKLMETVYNPDIAPSIKEDRRITLFDNDTKVTTQKVFREEESIFDYLTNSDDVAEIKNFDNSLNEFIDDNQLTLTDEQLNVFKSFNKNKFTLVIGPGGVGKTYTIGQLIKFVTENLGLKVKLAAPTGKAAKVLKGYTGHEASTLHHLFGILPGGQSTPAVAKKNMEGTDALVVDESSMMDSALFSEIIKTLQHYPNLRLVFVGDEFQLPSVGYGNILHTLINYNLCNTQRLTKVFRQKNADESGIVELSMQLRNGKVLLKNHQDEWYSVGSDLHVKNIETVHELHDQVISAYATLIKRGYEPEDMMVLNAKNAGLTGQAQLNVDLQRVYRTYKGWDDFETEFHWTKTYNKVETNFYKNDYVMVTKNQDARVQYPVDVKTKHVSQYSIVNGDTGRILEINDNYVVIQLEDYDFPVKIDKNEALSSLVLAYSITIHKSQGSQAKVGVMVIAPNDAYQVNANLIYTGISRFQEKLYLMGALKVLRAKSGTFENKNRDTILEYELKAHKYLNAEELKHNSEAVF